MEKFFVFLFTISLLATLATGCDKLKIPSDIPLPPILATEPSTPTDTSTAKPTLPASATPSPTETEKPLIFNAPTLDLRSTATRTPPPMTATPSNGWKLVWSDEFNGPNGSPVDASKWSYDLGGFQWGNKELECYTDRPENVHQADGNLVITAQKEQYQGCDYTSGRLVTKNKGDWLYGRFEARIKLPKGQGIWPAFWMLPTDEAYGRWPLSGEIDIMELLGNDPWTIYGTLHYGSPHTSEGKPFKSPNDKSYSDDYHLFAIEWDPREIHWYVDGFQYQTITDWFTTAKNSKFPAPFDKRFHMILNVAVGGVWPGEPDSTTKFPVEMLVDYVRVYQK